MLQSDQSPQSRRVLIKTADGAELAGRLFTPLGRTRAAMVLNGATGVPQSYYRAFAEHAAKAHGLAVLIYDYRDMGQSMQGPLRRSRATMADWGIADQQAARRMLQRLQPDTPLWVMGHSLGGMTLPMQTGTEGIARVICVASGSVHHTDHPWPYRALALLFWYGAGPVATALCGYMPGRMLRFGADLPAGVYWQWRRWCTTRGFFGGQLGHELPAANWPSAAGPVTMIAFADDDVVPPATVMALAALYKGGQVEHNVIAPADVGLQQIGHLGAFARRNRSVWDRLLT